MTPMARSDKLILEDASRAPEPARIYVFALRRVRTVTPGVAGSSPVHSANKINGLQQICCNPFFFVQTQGNS